jgi:hypothetical protein
LSEKGKQGVIVPHDSESLLLKRIGERSHEKWRNALSHSSTGEKTKDDAIVIEIQSVTAPSNTRLREKYGFEEIMKHAELSA